MAGSRIVWVPRSGAELSERWQRVRTTTDPKVELESYLLGGAAIVMPVLVVVGVPTPIVGRLIVAIVLGLLCLVALLITRRGLYLSVAGVRVWRGVRPQAVIPWTEVAVFRLGPDEVHAGDTENERVAVVRTDGEVTECWFLSRRTAFEAEPLPPGSAATMQSFPELVAQLNHIRDEMVAAD